MYNLINNLKMFRGIVVGVATILFTLVAMLVFLPIVFYFALIGMGFSVSFLWVMLTIWAVEFMLIVFRPKSWSLRDKEKKHKKEKLENQLEELKQFLKNLNDKNE